MWHFAIKKKRVRRLRAEGNRALIE